MLEVQRRTHRWNETLRPDGVAAVHVGHRHSLKHMFLASKWQCGELLGNGAAINQAMQQLNVVKSGSGSCCDFQSVLAAVGEIELPELPCFLVPKIWLDMVKADCWHDLLARAEWTHPEIHSLCRSLPVEWVQADKGRVKERDSGPSMLTAGQAAKACEFLRKAGPLMLENVLDEEQAATLHADVEQSLEALHQHEVFLYTNGLQRHPKLIATQSFVAQVLTAMDLRNQGELKKHASRFLKCLPESMQSFLDEWMKKHF